MVYLLSDLDLPLRGRTYREPEGRHVAIVRGRDLDHAFEHLQQRSDCRGLAVLEPPGSPPALGALEGRRVLVIAGDGAVMRNFSQAARGAGADVEWIQAERLPVQKVAAWALPVGAVVLAAGSASRMGSNKLLLRLDGKPLVRFVVEAATEGGCHSVVVVCRDDEVAAALRGHVQFVLNPNAEAGMSSSLKVGLKALGEEMAGAVILLGDQPLVGPKTVEMLLKAWRQEDARPAVAASYDGKTWRPPVVLDRSLWPELTSITGDGGARSLFDSHPELLETVPAKGKPDDVDTPADYRKIVKLFPTSRRR